METGGVDGITLGCVTLGRRVRRGQCGRTRGKNSDSGEHGCIEDRLITIAREKGFLLGYFYVET